MGHSEGSDAVELLLDRAAAVVPDLHAGPEDRGILSRICTALDGVPLAIELTAERLRSLSVGDLSARLDDQLALLVRRRAGGRRDDRRHASLRTVFDWSYALLNDDQRRLARCLSIFAGGFRLDAAEELCGGDVDILNGIDDLVAKSIVSFDTRTARYRLLEPLRQYLAEKLSSHGETAALETSHATWVAGMSRRLGHRLLDDQAARSRRLSEERGNIDLALRWAHDQDPDLALQIAGSLSQYWLYYDMPAGRRWCETVLTAQGYSPRQRARALLGAGMMAQNDHAWDRSVTRLREAVALYGPQGTSAGHAASLVVARARPRRGRRNRSPNRATCRGNPVLRREPPPVRSPR